MPHDLVERLRLLARGAVIPAGPIVIKAADLLEQQAARIGVLEEALLRVKRLSQRKDMGAPAKVACIESIVHTALKDTGHG